VRLERANGILAVTKVPNLNDAIITSRGKPIRHERGESYIADGVLVSLVVAPDLKRAYTNQQNEQVTVRGAKKKRTDDTVGRLLVEKTSVKELEGALRATQHELEGRKVVPGSTEQGRVGSNFAELGFGSELEVIQEERVAKQREKRALIVMVESHSANLARRVRGCGGVRIEGWSSGR